jgi:ribosomal protein S27AE
MTTHDLKTDPAVFSAVWAGEKTHEIRLNDRGFKVGDMLTLLETKHTGEEMRNGAPLEYTGRQTWREISHIQTGYGLGEGWCILSFKLPFPEAIAPPPQVAGIDDSDRERLLYVARVLRGAANLGRNSQLGDQWSEILMAFGTVKRVLALSDDDIVAMNDPELLAKPVEAKQAKKGKVRASGSKKVSEPEKRDFVWECNECGSQEYTSAVSEEDVNTRLACGSCGGDEFHREYLSIEEKP